MPGGQLFGTLFFILVVFAAWTSSISLIEPAITWLVENKGMQRIKACILTGIITWFLGVGTVLSFNLWSDYKVFGKTFFDLLDYLTANIMLPLGGLFIALFAGWIMTREATQDELHMKGGVGYLIWHFLLRYVTPLGVAVVFLHAIGVI